MWSTTRKAVLEGIKEAERKRQSSSSGASSSSSPMGGGEKPTAPPSTAVGDSNGDDAGTAAPALIDDLCSSENTWDIVDETQMDFDCWGDFSLIR